MLYLNRGVCHYNYDEIKHKLNDSILREVQALGIRYFKKVSQDQNES